MVIVRYLELRELKYIINRLRDLYPQDYIVLHKPEALELIIYDMSLYSNVYRKRRNRVASAAASLLYNIVDLHPLTDGNKRFAALTLYTFLFLNNYIVPRHIVYKLCLLVAEKKIGKEDVYKWLLRNIKPLKK